MNINKKKICLTILVILFLIIVYTLLFPQVVSNSTSFEVKDRSTLDELKNNDNITQTFVSNGDYTHFGISLATYGQIYQKGKLIIKITNEKGKTKKFNLKMSSIADNSTCYFKYKLKKGKKYTLNINIKKSDVPITVYTTKAKIKDSSLTVNDKSLKQNIILSFMYPKKDYFLIWYSILGMACVSCYLTLIMEDK